MSIKFDNAAKNFARSRGMQTLPQRAMAKMDTNDDGAVSLGEAARAGTMARLDGDGSISPQERSRLAKILGLSGPTGSTSPAPTRTPARPTPTRPTRTPSSAPRPTHTTSTTPSRPPTRRAGEGLQLSRELLVQHDDYDRSKLEAWSDLINDNLDQPVEKKLHLANAFMNSRLMYASDQQVWQKRDFWATPVESLAKGGGDCDDFTIGKYVTLRKMGIPKADLKLAVVYHLKPGKPRQAHMVLLHQPPGGKTTILDNIDKSMKSISERRDLSPVYTFNETGLWLSRGEKWDAQLSGTADRLSKWGDMVGRMEREGIW